MTVTIEVLMIYLKSRVSVKQAEPEEKSVAEKLVQEQTETTENKLAGLFTKLKFEQ